MKPEIVLGALIVAGVAVLVISERMTPPVMTGGALLQSGAPPVAATNEVTAPLTARQQQRRTRAALALSAIGGLATGIGSALAPAPAAV